MADRSGQHLGHYRLERLLGRGGHAEVYLAEHRYLHTHVALKLLHPSSEAVNQERFLREAQLLATLIHPHIVRLLDFGVAEETAFFVMDYAPSGSLANHFPAGQPVPIEQMLAPLQQAASALDYAHAHERLHLDVKPENLLLGRRQEVWLSDFGIAMVAGTRLRPGENAIPGTAAFMAPEQIRGEPVPESDQYSLGVVVYEWLTGALPFVGTSLEMAEQHVLAAPPPLREQVPTLSPKLESIVLRALAKDPQARFASVSAFAQTLIEAWQDEGIGDVAAPGARNTPVSDASRPRVTPRLMSPAASVLEPAQEEPDRAHLSEPGAEAGGSEGHGTTPSRRAVHSGSGGREAPPVNAAHPARAGKRSGTVLVLAACLAVLLIAILIISSFAFQGGGALSTLGRAIEAGVGQQERTPTPVGFSPVPTAQPTISLSPTTAVPSPTVAPSPTASGPSPTPGSQAFFISPTSSAQTCSTSLTNLPGIRITLDNTSGQAAVTWQVQITQVDASGSLWASAMPKSGTIAAGQTAQLLVKPEKSLCQQHPTTTFQATITYQTPGGSGTILFSDGVTSTSLPQQG